MSRKSLTENRNYFYKFTDNMLKIITSIALKPAACPAAEFRRVPLISPFGNLKTATTREDAGELLTITLTATLRSDDAFLHEPVIVRVKWRGGSLVFGSKDIPALLTLTEEETLVATCKYQTSIEAAKG